MSPFERPTNAWERLKLSTNVYICAHKYFICIYKHTYIRPIIMIIQQGSMLYIYISYLYIIYLQNRDLEKNTVRLETRGL